MNDQPARPEIASVAVPFFANFSDEEAAKVNAGELADAVTAEERDEAQAQANLDALADLLPPPADRAAVSVKQRADCTELEWAEQERARFERLYTRESVRADQAEAEAERLREQLEGAEDTAEQLVRNVQTVARDRESYRKAWKEEQQRRVKAEAEAEWLRTDRAIDVITPAELVAALRGAGEERDRLDAADRATISRVRDVLPFAEEVIATTGIGPASAVRAVVDRLRAALDPEAAAPVGVQAVCKCPAEVCGCGHHAGVQTDGETSRG